MKMMKQIKGRLKTQMKASIAAFFTFDMGVVFAEVKLFSLKAFAFEPVIGKILVLFDNKRPVSNTRRKIDKLGCKHSPTIFGLDDVLSEAFQEYPHTGSVVPDAWVNSFTRPCEARYQNFFQIPRLYSTD